MKYLNHYLGKYAAPASGPPPRKAEDPRPGALTKLTKPPLPLAGPPWDQAEAERLLAGLRAAVARARQDFGGRFPEGLDLAVADLLAVAEHHHAHHEAEARRGWDSLASLRRLGPWLLEVIGRGRLGGQN